jgi:plastocyanin
VSTTDLGRPRSTPGERSGDSTGFGWRRLQLVAALAVVASLVVPMVISLSVEVFLLAMAAPFVVGLLLMLRWRRVAAVWLGLVSVALLLFSAPFIVDALAHPESIVDFIPLVVLTVSLLIGVIAAIPSFRRGKGPDAPSRPARAFGVAALGVLVVTTVFSIASFAAIEDVGARPGDILVVTEDFEFHPGGIHADEGTISVHVTNRDDTRHTFTVDVLGVDLNVPPNSTQRVSFTAEPGTYRFVCRPHAPGMEGTLILS